MKTTLLTASCTALLLAFASTGDTLDFHAPAKTKLTKTFETKLDMTSTDMSITFDGEDAHGGMEAPTIKISDEEKIVVVDEYLAVDDDRATKLQRTFDDLSGTAEQDVEMPDGSGMESQEESKEKSSPLEGKAVVFTWADDAYEAKWKEGVEGDDDLLEGLAGELDFAAFLPSKAVADGDTWDVAPKTFAAVFSPGGRLQLKEEGEDEDDEGSEESMQEQVEKNLDGKATAKYRGTREVDGVRLAVIELTAELESNAALDEDGGKTEISAKFGLSGEVLWNPKAGHMSSYKITGKIGFTMETSRSMDLGGESHSYSQKIEFEGDVEYRAEFE
jgi:hypothetical protein